MQTVHRQFGRFMKRSADDSQISVLLKEFEDADKLLSRIIESTKAWRDSWAAILTHQGRLVQEFDNLYAPIIGSSDPNTTRPSVETPENIQRRTRKLYEEYESLRSDLLVEVKAVDERMIQPAQQAKELLLPMKKTIKKREEKKLDYEHYQGRVDNYSKKTKRSDRDNAALARAESDLARATEEYQAADENLRQHLPPLISAVFSILPHLLAAQIQIQNTLLGHYYTVLHTYCEQEQFPSPPPPMEQVVSDWKAAFVPVQQQAESLGCLANGKTVRQAMNGEELYSGSGVGGVNGFGSRRPSSFLHNHRASIGGAPAPPRNLAPPMPVYETKPRLSDLPGHLSAQTGASSPPPADSGRPAQSPSSSSSSPVPPASGYVPAGPYHHHHATTTSNTAATAVAAAAAAVKKRPPPPPPPPRSSSSVQPQYVTALYDFGGQGPGDLSFREGDRIRVLKRTESTDDWWEGELHGVRGSFPANYCQITR